MKNSKIFLIYKKELKEVLRDRRTLIAMIVIPLLLYPVMMSLGGQLIAMGKQKLSDEKSIIANNNELPDSLDNLINRDDTIKRKSTNDPKEDLKNSSIHAYIELKETSGTDSIYIYYDGASERSVLAGDRVAQIIAQFKRHMNESSLLNAGIDISLLDQFGQRKINAAPPSRMTGRVLGLMIPMLLVIMLIMGAMYPAIDLTAGEKERGTLETILTVPVQRFDLLMGKLLTVSTIALITGLLNLFSLALVYSLNMIQMGPESGDLGSTFSLITIALVIALIIPLAIFISAVMLSVGLFARSFKDGQNLMNPVMIILMLPAFVGLMPGIELNEFIVLVPILNIVLLFKEIMLQNIVPQIIFTVILSNILFATIAILVFSKLFNTEQMLFGEGKGQLFSFRRSEINRAKVFQPGAALLLFTGLFIVLFYLSAFLFMEFKGREYLAILITQWGLLFPVVIIAIWYNKIDFKRSLFLKGFSGLSFLGSTLLIVGGTISAMWIGQLQFDLFPEWKLISEGQEGILMSTFLSLNPVLVFFILAVTPAVCEELLFRGILLSSLKERISAKSAMIVVAIIFGIYHLQIFRLVPTALLGFYLTYIVYKTGSIYLGMFGHMLNNSIGVLIMFNAQFFENMGWFAGNAPIDIYLIAAMVLLIISGAVLIKFSKTEKSVVQINQPRII
jgi:sodium transport system permease protein